jgi:hypothetical protein
MPQPHDLDALANSAAKAIESAEARRASLMHRKPGRKPWLKIAVTALVAGFFLHTASDGRAKRFWLGVSEQQQIAEMTAALTAARLAVDSSQSTTGEWPNQVPLPALAALVELQGPGPNYRLRARTQRWLLIMTPSGDVQRTQP